MLAELLLFIFNSFLGQNHTSTAGTTPSEDLPEKSHRFVSSLFKELIAITFEIQKQPSQTDHSGDYSEKLLELIFEKIYDTMIALKTENQQLCSSLGVF